MIGETPNVRSYTREGRLVALTAGVCAAGLLLPSVQVWFYAAGLRWLYVLLVSYLIAVGVTPLIRELAFTVGAVDHPSPRKIHQTATPLLGGVAVYLAFVIALLANAAGLADPLIVTEGMLGVLGGGTVLFLVGIRDDIREVPAGMKLAVQIVAAGIVIWSGKLLSLFPHGLAGDTLNVLLTVLWIVGITNAFNFFDGMDGLATGLAVIIAFFMGVVAFQTNQPFLGWLSVAVMGACIGFLPYNFGPGKPAEIFLGDSGSNFLGFTLASIAVMGEWSERSIISSLITPLLIFSVLIYDMIYLTVSRFATGRVNNFKEWLDYVGKDHLHHRFACLLRGRKKSVLFICLLSFTLGLNALLLRTADAWSAVILLSQVVCILIIVTVMEITSNKTNRRLGK